MIRENRIALLTTLLEDPQRHAEVAQQLRHLGWDSDDEFVELSPVHLVSVLAAFLAGQLTTPELESWANAVESRDDVGRRAQGEATTNEALHWLANPVLEGEITDASAKHWIVRLSSPG